MSKKLFTSLIFNFVNLVYIIYVFANMFKLFNFS